MPLSVGQVLQGRYRVVASLGRGGMGAVYRGWDMRLDVSIAMKEMTPQPGLDAATLAQLRQQFEQEATILARLNHPHLVRVTDFFEESGNAYLVMDFVEGESLARRIEREHALSERQVLAWADQLLDALAYCHAQGILHRDVKPQNVIIAPDGHATLVDFGLVKLWNPNDPHTRTAMRGMGTPQYAPPEQYDTGTGHTDARSDIYSLGATLYHALAGQAPPTATQRIVKPGALSPSVSTHTESVLLRAMELQPEARFSSAAELRRALREPPLAATAAYAVAPAAPAGHAALPGPPQAAAARTTIPPRQTVRRQPQRRGLTWPLILLIGGGGLAALVLIIAAAVGARWVFGTRPAGMRPTDTPPAIATPAPVESPQPQESAAVTAASVATDVTPTPSKTAALTATPTPTGTPGPTDTPTSTATDTVTPTPTDTPTPSPSPTPACAAAVDSRFTTLYETRRERLGCPVGDAGSTAAAEQRFEGGRVFWQQDTDQIVVLYAGGTWTARANGWSEGDPDYSCPESAPSESPPTPLRGFGWVWCNVAGVRDGLGWATAAERGFGALVQVFDYGRILHTDEDESFVIYADGSWE